MVGRRVTVKSTYSLFLSLSCEIRLNRRSFQLFQSLSSLSLYHNVPSFSSSIAFLLIGSNHLTQKWRGYIFRPWLLINEINQNHESKIPDNLSRNVGLIRELNNNIRRVVDLYADLSTSFTKSMDASSEGDSSGALKSDGKAGHKRHRPG
ncbi:hypothetical protein Pfo_003858 [Paulownia fortunei]|nr:hypothetical protein Pfo_003858 [Paulownia fortunei]